MNSQTNKTKLPTHIELGENTSGLKSNSVVLAEQITSIPSFLLILTISIGVGICMLIASARSLFGLDLNKILIFSFSIIFILMLFVPIDFIPVAFDSGGVTTGTISIPFIITLGIGLVSSRVDNKAKEDSFGLVALASTGPILMVLLLGLFNGPEKQLVFDNSIYTDFSFFNYINQLSICLSDVLLAIIPILIVFIILTHSTSDFSLQSSPKWYCKSMQYHFFMQIGGRFSGGRRKHLKKPKR